MLRDASLRFRLIPTSAVRWSIFLARGPRRRRVERARIIIAYLDTPSAYVVARQIGVSQQTVMRCLERAAEWGSWQRSMTGHEPDAMP